MNENNAARNIASRFASVLRERWEKEKGESERERKREGGREERKEAKRSILRGRNEASARNFSTDAGDKRRRRLLRGGLSRPLCVGPRFAIESEQVGNVVLAVCAGPAGSLTDRPSAPLNSTPLVVHAAAVYLWLKSGLSLSLSLSFSLSPFLSCFRLSIRGPYTCLFKKKKKSKIGYGKQWS